jgi:AcrR family transcriptional regulator
VSQNRLAEETLDDIGSPGLGMETVQARNREQRIAHILRTARQAFQEDGYAGFSVRGVAARLGITLGNLQYYFKTRDELLQATLSEEMRKTLGLYASIANQPGLSAQRRCSTFVEHSFHDNNDTDLPRLLFEAWALAQHDSKVAELVDNMYAQYRGIFAKLLAETNPTLAEEECLARAFVLTAQLEGMMIFAYRSADSQKDHAEFVRITKRSVRMLAGLTAQSRNTDWLDTPAPESRGNDGRDKFEARTGVLGSDAVEPNRIELEVKHATQDGLCYRPTMQSKRRQSKINEIVSVAATILATEGYANFTQARIAKELAILPSALQHYFPTIDDLLRTSIGTLLATYQDRYREMGVSNGKSAVERLGEIFDDVFEENLDARVVRFCFEMFALAQRSDFTHDFVRSMYSAYRAIFVDLIREIDSSATARECLARATLIAAQLEGAMILTYGARKRTPGIDRAREIMRTLSIQIARGAQ